MNTYKWVEPEDIDVLTLQKNNDPILQITKEGGLYAPAALFTSLPMDNSLEGNILSINERGVVMTSPITLKTMSDSINIQLSTMNEGVKNSLQSIQKQLVDQFNKSIDMINTNLLSIQSDMLTRSIPAEDLKIILAHSEKLKQSEQQENIVVEGRENYHDDHDPVERRYRRLEQMILLLFVLFAFLFILIASIGFMSSKSKK